MDPIAKEAIQVLKAIALQGGNIPDEIHMEATGPNDARQRGIMYVNCREMARKFIQEHSPETLQFDETGTPIV